MSARTQRLWVCWTRPLTAIPPGDALLSFLPPAEEDALPPEQQALLISARDASAAVRPEARRAYFDLVARIGTAPMAPAGTFRSALARVDAPSQWWFHRVSFKDCESDPTFDLLIAIATIRRVAEGAGISCLRLVGAPAVVAGALGDIFDVDVSASVPSAPLWRVAARSLASRVKFAALTLRQIHAVRHLAAVAPEPLDAALLGFWDWTVAASGPTGGLADRYFKRLPEALRAGGARAVGWMVWLDPSGDPRAPRRPLADVLAPLAGRLDVVVLQTLLRWRDVFRAAADFSGLRAFLRIRRTPAFRARLVERGVDYLAVFAQPMLRGFLDAQIPQCELMRVAAARAIARGRPRLVFSSFEHFPLARAQYSAVPSGARPAFVAVQHASYTRDKTFLHLDPVREFGGEPDGCRVPVPALVCVMGELGRELFLDCGYPPGRVVATGSPRYDDAPSLGRRPHRGAGGPPVLLIVTAVHVGSELEMAEAAWLAARDVPVELRLRSHPFRPLECEPAFAPLAARIAVSRRTLAEDLDEADVVLFTQSTVAEEAWLRGIPAWQWLTCGFNGSALADTVAIPQFGSVAALRAALIEFCANRSAFAPAQDLRSHVVERLFHRLDGAAAERVAAACRRYFGEACGGPAILPGRPRSEASR